MHQTTASCCIEFQFRQVSYRAQFMVLCYPHCTANIEFEIRLFVPLIRENEDTVKSQNDIDRFGAWARKWGMRIQAVKCNMMQLARTRTKINAEYTYEGTILQNVDKIKYLRVTITEDSRWNTHVSNICTKANRTLGFLRRNV